jgi:hypothetical protein
MSSIRDVANDGVSCGVISRTRPSKPSRRLTFTVRICSLPKELCYLIAYRLFVVSPWLYINDKSPTPLPTATRSTAHSGVNHSTQYTQSRYLNPNKSSSFIKANMAPHYGHAAQRTAHRFAHNGVSRQNSSNANNLTPRLHGHRTATGRDGDRARETHRRRNLQERRSDALPMRSPSPLPLRRPSYLDRMTYGNDNDARGPFDHSGGYDPPSRLQHGRSLQDRITCDDHTSRNGGPVQPVPQRSIVGDSGSSGRGQAVRTNTEYTEDKADMAIDNAYDIFAADPPDKTTSIPRTTWQPPSTKPAQYGSSDHLPFSQLLHLTRPIQPTTRTEPIHLLNSFTPHEPALDKLQFKAPKKVARLINTYRGNDPIKRLVQNKKLQRLLSDKGVSKPRKKPDRMDLKCAGSRVFR